jgi:20S proteasome subunit beta 5
MNRFVQRYSSSPLQLPREENFDQVCGKWDAAQDLAFPSFDIPAVHNVK